MFYELDERKQHRYLFCRDTSFESLVPSPSDYQRTGSECRCHLLA